MKVRLTPTQLALAATVGCARHITALFRNAGHTFNPGVLESWGAHIEGAAAELALSVCTGLPWTGKKLNDFTNPDVGRWQVRARSSTPHLIVRPKDSDHDVFILAFGASPEFEFLGWMFGEEAKQEKWVRDKFGRPYYLVPLPLHPMDDLTRVEIEAAQQRATDAQMRCFDLAD